MIEERPRILHITRQYAPAKGGIESVVHGLCNELTKKNYQVDILTLNKVWDQPKVHLKKEEMVEKIKITRIPFWGPRRYAIAPSVLRYIKDYDIIHLHSSDFFLDYMAMTEPLHQKPIVLHSHGLYFHTNFAKTFKKYYFNTFTKVALKKVKKVICVSKTDKQILSNITSEEKLIVIPNGISMTSQDKKIEEKKYGIILSVGRLNKSKRYNLLLTAFAEVQKAIPESKLVILGKDQGELQSLVNLSNDLGINENVRFLGEVPDETLSHWLSIAPVWATASGYESFGVAALEAMSFGCVPVVQDLAAFNEYLVDGVNGFITDFTDRNYASTRLIESLNLSVSRRDNVVSNAVKTAKNYSWPTIADEVDSVYRNILSMQN